MSEMGCDDHGELQLQGRQDQGPRGPLGGSPPQWQGRPAPSDHSNEDIRADLTKFNVSYVGGGYGRRLARAKARLGEVSPEGGPREGAVLFQLVNVPVPQGIADGYSKRTRKRADAEARSRSARLDERERDLAKRKGAISDAEAELEAARLETMRALADARRKREEAEEALEAARSGRAVARSAMQAIWSMVFGRDEVPMPADERTFMGQVRGEMRRRIDRINDVWDKVGAISVETRDEVARRRHVDNDPAEALASEFGLDDEPTM